jgi:hypothetical protein
MIVFIIMVYAVGCQQEGKGFALPQGDTMAGKATFTALRCNECHSIADVKWIGNGDDPHVPLGGEVNTIKTYGELVTSVINPSHKISKPHRQYIVGESGQSKMMVYNEIMTVQELIDIVTFLQSEYEIKPSDHIYPPYY